MYLTEFFNEKMPDGHYTDKEDNSAKKMTDLRSTRLTLSRIRQLRKMNDLKKFEKQQNIEKLQKQYKAAGQPAETAAI